MKSIYYFGVFILFVFVSTLSITGCNGDRSNNERQINVVFRFDDPSADSDSELEFKVIDAFREHNASVTFGVIPFICAGDVHDTSPQDVIPLGPKKGKLLGKAVEEGVLDIAMHGYSHQTRISDVKHRTEFRGLDYDSQFEKLSKGKKLLEEMTKAPISAFIPPWNQYDLNTLKALEKLGFSTLSAAIDGKAPDSSGLNFMPFTCRIPEVREAVSRARTSSDRQPLIIVMFHSYDFSEHGQKGRVTFGEFYKLLGWLGSQNDVRFLSISQAAKEISDLSAKRLRLSYMYDTVEPIVPKFLRLSDAAYSESSLLVLTLTMIALLYFFIAVFGMAFSYSVACLLFSKSAAVIKIGSVGSTIMTVALILYAISDLSVGLSGMVIITILVGFSIGLWFCFLSRKRKIRE